MALSHEVNFVDFNLSNGVLAGEAVPQEAVPAPEAIGMVAVAPELNFGSQTPRPSEVAKAQLDAEGAPEPGQVQTRQRQVRTVAERRAQRQGNGDTQQA